MKSKRGQAYREAFYNDRPQLLDLFCFGFQTIYNDRSVAALIPGTMTEYCVKAAWVFPVTGLPTAVLVFFPLFTVPTLPRVQYWPEQG